MKNLIIKFVPYFSLMMIAQIAFSCYSFQAQIIDLPALSPLIRYTRGINGGENLHLDPLSFKSYITALDGTIHLFDGENRFSLMEVTSIHPGDSALGIAADAQGNIYFGSGKGEWLKEGAAIWKASPDLTNAIQLTSAFPCLNGVDMDDAGNLYFASAKLSLLNPGGNIYKISAQQLASGTNLSTQLFLPDLKVSANGVFIEPQHQTLYFSGTFKGVESISLDGKDRTPIVGKSRMVEGFDDLCVDGRGLLYIADQPNGFLKLFDMESGQLWRIHLDGFGVASSCRMREEISIRTGEKEEIIYVTEFKKKTGDSDFSGDCFVSLPVEMILRAAGISP